MKDYVTIMIIVAQKCLKENEKKYLPGEKSSKAPFIAYVDLECILKKIQYCQNNPKNSYTERKAEHRPSRYPWSSICSFDNIKNKHYLYRGKDCIEKLCKDLKEFGTEIIYFKMKEMKALTDKEIRYYEKQKVCYICEIKFCDDKNKKSECNLYHRVRDHCQEINSCS